MSEHIYEDSDMEHERYHVIPFGWMREQIVRCRDCKHYCESTVDEDGDGEPSWCMYWEHEWLRDDGFCAWGERRENA